MMTVHGFLLVIAFLAVIVFAATAIIRAEKRHEGVWRQEEDDDA